MGGGLKGRGEVDTMTGGDDLRDRFLDIFALDGLDVSDTLLVGGFLVLVDEGDVIGDEVLTVNLCNVSTCKLC